MQWFNDIYTFFHSIFEYLSFRKKPMYNSIEDAENPSEYEFIILNENKMVR